jgi:hypothetical protein
VEEKRPDGKAGALAAMWKQVLGVRAKLLNQEWMVWAARSAPYQKGDEEKDEITRIVMAVIFAVPALLSLFASVYLFSHR